MHRNLECQVHESRQIGSGQTGDGKSEHQHSRNQRPPKESLHSLRESFQSSTTYSLIGSPPHSVQAACLLPSPAAPPRKTTFQSWLHPALPTSCPLQSSEVPHPEPSSLLPPRTIPLGRPSAPAPSIHYRASNLAGDSFHISR